MRRPRRSLVSAERTRSASHWAFILLLPLALGGTGLTAPSDHAPPTVEERDLEVVAARLGVALLGIAFAPSGRGFYDNSLPCPRRGLIHYLDSDLGRRATFFGCDLGAGVVVDGRGELSWAEPGFGRDRGERFCDPTCPRQLRWDGPLEVRGEGGSPLSVSNLWIGTLVLAPGREGRFP